MARSFAAEYEWSQEHGFEYGGPHDAGNGALVTRGRSQQFPSVIAVRYYSYCKREPNTIHYEIDGDPSRPRRAFQTAAAAQAAAAQLASIPTEVLECELASRRSRR